MTEQQVLKSLRKRVDDSDVNTVARELGVSIATVYTALGNRQQIGEKLAKAMGLEIRRMYFKVTDATQKAKV